MTNATNDTLTITRPTDDDSARSTASPWDLLVAVTVRDIRVRYHGTFLFYFWWIARPLMLGLVLYFALGHVLQLDVPNHAIFLLSALFPWFWFQNAVHGATGAFVGNGGLMKKVRFPRAVLPLSVVLGSAVEFAAALPVLVLIVLINGIDPEWAWLIGVPLLMILQLALLAGLALAIAPVNVYFRDLAPGLDAVMTLLFYMTPIIYPLEKVPSNIQPLLQINPLVSLIEAWRELFLFGQLPGLDVWPALVFTAAALVAGAFTLRALDENLADAL